mmetsp:Transcript_50250/g.75020  ORF Transcript_50250/g.75020 Transcript_50250/m.75020 type:complete len:101 (-) Transcript_50250:954-1256(-)
MDLAATAAPAPPKPLLELSPTKPLWGSTFCDATGADLVLVRDTLSALLWTLLLGDSLVTTRGTDLTDRPDETTTLELTDKWEDAVADPNPHTHESGLKAA